MAKRNVKDPAALVNNSSQASSANEEPPERKPRKPLSYEEHIEDLIAKVDALVTVAQLGGLHNCTKVVHFRYLSVLDALMEEIRLSFWEMHGLHGYGKQGQ